MVCCFNAFQRQNCFHLNALDFTSAEWGIPRWAYILYRTVVFLYWLAILVVCVVQFEDVSNYFIYLSHLGQLLMVLYFAAALLCSMIRDSVNPNELNREKKRSENKSTAKWYHWATLSLYTTSFGTAIIVTVGYPFLVAQKTTDPLEFASFQKHIVNIVLMLFDMFLNRIPVNFWYFPFASVWSIFYALLSLSLHWSGVNSAVYSASDFVNSPTTAWLMAFGFVTVCPLVMQLFMCLCYFVKMCLVKQCYGHREGLGKQLLAPAIKRVDVVDQVPSTIAPLAT